MKATLEPALAFYAESTATLQALVDRILSDEEFAISPADFIAIADEMHDGTAELASVVLGELRLALENRISTDSCGNDCDLHDRRSAASRSLWLSSRWRRRASPDLSPA